MTVSILVVDDESDVAELYRQRFRREVRQGTYAMHFANSGEDALGKLAGGVEPNLIAILSDINMPGMDGLDLLGEIKRRYPELPVMMVTAYGDDESRGVARPTSCSDWPESDNHLRRELNSNPGISCARTRTSRVMMG
jgi:CheY-like chemotaxis protein